MTNKIDYQKLREIAEKTKIAGEAPVMPFDQRINALNDFMKHFSPDIALALLDEVKRLEDTNIDAMCRIAELESNRATLAAEHGIQIAINELLALAPRLDKRAVDALSVAVEHLCKLIKKEAVSEQN
ncbi:hypothetical protein ACL60U_01295 (plasmid) [Escherichia coli]|uniref:hypothetical protein n=1 Tax=Escherichia coli TaxID=562 RepID=UPI00107AF8B1|nr:hypothetical protein [Salmonella enterica subsp. enterica serovar Corvallis]MCS1254641.1 hypothetical protein [Escherichia coli]EBF9469452.1 hypothetical protein [Salmonella enterica subsp. enterica serovar Corvallis]EBV3101972.1 hypothetical protein [Salmonella enterica subsp. enterica serovar Corvallis]EBZ5454617.1 hypothetical protein [Salmonella enterica subsp. enterica serovar Corvallis]